MKIYAIEDDPITLALVAVVLRIAGHPAPPATTRATLREIPHAQPDCVITEITTRTSPTPTSASI